jgi:hypothetical protein
VASGVVQLSLLGKIVAECAAKVSVLICGKSPQVTGGKQTRYVIEGGADWCKHYGVPIKRGRAVLYKGLDKDLTSSRGTLYEPGTTVESHAWNAAECDAGLHFSPSPAMTREFDADGLMCRWVACEVAVKDLLVFPEGSYAGKAKAPKCRVLYECDEDGRRIEAGMSAAGGGR